MGAELNLLPISKWFNNIELDYLLIAGPCSAESQLQMIETAQAIHEVKRVTVFRAGIWKPRTRPGSFEGVGAVGLPWLQEVKNKFGLLTATEVATPEHIKQAIYHGVDILWIGARTTANPFSIQALADALIGVDIPVLIKNPVNPDIQLWVGALERINKAGITKLGVVHRGFFPFEKTELRNIPKWEIAIELKEMFPELPMICDPSHISGNSEFVPFIAQKALDLNMNGLMIESHINPSVALSDAKQQLSPTELLKLFDELIFRRTATNGNSSDKFIDKLREKIDLIDIQMLDLLAQRMDIISDIGKYKQQNNMSILQLRRWQNIIKSRIAYGEKVGLKKDFVKKILQIVHKESINKQSDLYQHRKPFNK